jgi:glycosyltransferase involved in cell wall biosynthesis
MSRIVMADDGVTFDGLSLREGPLGGSETSFALLAEAFAHRGHCVVAGTNTRRTVRYQGVEWRPLWENGLPEEADLYIGNRGHRVIPLVPKAERAVFWIHNPAEYLLKWRYLVRLWRRRPPIVFLGDHHASTYPWWGPGGERVVIPLGVNELFRHAEERAPPPRQAIFTSNPLRGLDWLLDLWTRRIWPSVPDAQLILFTGSAMYGNSPAAPAARVGPILERARQSAASGVVLREPILHRDLATELAAARVMLYRGDAGETFCLSLAEAQAMGVPVVVAPVASVPERVIDGMTGFVAKTDEAFAQAAVRLLTDDALWLAQHRAALARQRSRSWDTVAADFERLMAS